jgi:hypothetical protein
MKTTVVPAQVTTVEDKIAGRLGLTQMLLLIAPIFGGSALYAVLPPFMGSTPYKLALVVVLAALFGVLAIRVKGKLLLAWAVVIARYNLRPQYFVYDKNDPYLRDVSPSVAAVDVDEMETEREAEAALPCIGLADMVKIQSLMADPKANVHFKTTRKGELSVHISQSQ